MFIEIAVISICLALGGVLKGATGAGGPILALPVMAAIFDVPFAVAILVMPNLVTNAWQIVEYRGTRPTNRFLILFVGGGAVGTAVGTWLLASLSSDALLAALGACVLAYIGLRVARPHFRIPGPIARLLALPAGIGGGVLQGATGLSAPVTLTFLNAVRLERPIHMFTVSTLFLVFVAVQIPALSYAGILTVDRFWLSVLAVAPTVLAMPLGARLASRLPAQAFDRVILALLAVLAVKMLVEAVL
ncbi:MAG: sulfite exporter TauE/SafE family protein [Alphaproteobacteria bacterium]